MPRPETSAPFASTAPPLRMAHGPLRGESPFAMPPFRPRVGDPAVGGLSLRHTFGALGLWSVMLGGAGVAMGWLVLS